MFGSESPWKHTSNPMSMPYGGSGHKNINPYGGSGQKKKKNIKQILTLQSSAEKRQSWKVFLRETKYWWEEEGQSFLLHHNTFTLFPRV